METCKEYRDRLRREARRKKLGAAAAKRLLAAADALSRYSLACMDCGERLPLDDDRRLTADRMLALGHHLDAVHNKEF